MIVSTVEIFKWKEERSVSEKPWRKVRLAREAVEGKQSPLPCISQTYFGVTGKQMMCHIFCIVTE